MAVYQSGDDIPPPLLFRFRAAVGGLGLIHGPARGSRYQWHTKSHPILESVTEVMWPWLGTAKRAQLSRAAAEVGRVVPAFRDAQWSPKEGAAWAAGFFDGEGSVGVIGDPRRTSVWMELPQASASGIPEVLARFLAIVGVGRISGPRRVPSPWSKLPQYRWEVARFADVERVADMLYPHADIVKRERMFNCLDRVRRARAVRTRR
ncbi:MAG: hypothetical protein M3O64_03435 [Chloroflexota bacterium]|nr:hypothetical protein [Chloroflexota bacterium]